MGKLTKINFDDREKGLLMVPLTRLYFHLNNQKWFKKYKEHLYILDKQTELQWKEKRNYPRLIRVEYDYYILKDTCLSVDLCVEEVRKYDYYKRGYVTYFEIYLSTFHNSKHHRTERRFNHGRLYLTKSLKKYRASSLEKAESTIKKLLNDEEEGIEEELEILKIEKQRIREELLTARQIEKELDLTLSSNPKNILEMSYKYSKYFGMSFAKDKKEDSYYIRDIRGNFTLKQIKEFINLIAGCPQAVADKLKGDTNDELE